VYSRAAPTGIERSGNVSTPYGVTFDEIGNWTEIKLEIIRKYAKAYSTIINNRSGFHHVYVDGFCGAGQHVRKGDKQIVSGSPRIALEVKPEFREYHFIDMDAMKLNYLKEIVGNRENVHYYNGDCNTVLLKEVFPKIRYDRFQRGLCLLDPYGLHLNWEVVETAGRSRAIEMFLNFPTTDMNRNVLWTNPRGVSAANRDRMNRFWGNDSWEKHAYREELTLFGPETVKTDFRDIVNAYSQRLTTVAEFKYVPDPLPMRNSKGAVVYYLFFASCNATANKIVRDIFSKYRE
jgi:three-Cys-motif partner protein